MIADVVVDLQFGSCGKGRVASELVKRAKYDASVKAQGTQSGHTVEYDGNFYVMRTIPVSWVDPNVYLCIGPGAILDKQLLLSEVEMLTQLGVNIRDRLMLDYRAWYLTDEDKLSESTLEESVGSTAQGNGAALVRKIWRQKPTRVADDSWATENGLKVGDVVEFLSDKVVLVEGSQGTLLSLHTSPYYPYVTSRECTASAIIAECGISPRFVRHIHGVCRTHPIRVGGNSGETGGKELSWEALSEALGRPTLERTSVTNRVRRLFEWSNKDLKLSIALNAPTHIHLTHVDYLSPEDEGCTDWDRLSKRTKDWIIDKERVLDVEFCHLTTGRLTSHSIWR